MTGTGRLSLLYTLLGMTVGMVLATGGCVNMTPVPEGTLSTTYEQRFTDEAIMRDWAAMDTLRKRIAELRPQAPTGYIIARAEAELNFAVDEYEENDSTGILDSLLNDARHLTLLQEQGLVEAVDVSLPELPGITEISSDLWQLTEQAKENPILLTCAGDAIATLEVGLLALGHEQYEVDEGLNTSEHLESQTLLVDHMVIDLRGRLDSAACRPSTPPVAPVLVQGITLSVSALFPFNQCGENDILPAGKVQLDHFGAELIKHSDSWHHLVIRGHADRLGRHDLNLRLSQCRAEAVRSYLIKKFGLSPEHIETHGMTAMQPIVFCSGPVNESLKACLQPNRRVEIRVQ